MGNMSSESALIIVAVCIVIFLICREIICWYWKLNRIVTLLEDIRRELKKTNASIGDSEKIELSDPLGLGRIIDLTNEVE